MLCEVCEASNAVATCRLCGRNACANHIDSGGLCSICKETLCKLCSQRLSVSSCAICGRIICRECSVELQPAIRVCKECFSKILYSESYSKYRKYLRRFAKNL
ncbi:MAG: hypothetical protein N3G48_02950 [Sulfolobales archaeon]|nr:hypothetical protein [Sulfolobales archaeon]